MRPEFRQYAIFAGMLCCVLVAVPWAYTRIHQDAVVHHRAGQSFMAGDYQNAARLYRMSVEKGMDGTRVLQRLGDTYLALGEFDRALEVFLKIQSRKPENLALQVKLAHVHSLNNNTGQALALIDQVLEKKPDWDAARLWKARILARDRRFAEAIDIYYQTLGESP